MVRTLRLCGLFLGITFLVSGCADSVTKHSILSALFDGVPGLPTTEKLCEDEMGDQYKEFYEALAREEAIRIAEEGSKGLKKIVSRHMPFVEKNCKGCHNFKATNRLITEKNQLCYVCHTDFIKGKYVHGPVAVGDCMACHLPHDAKYTSLLKEHKNYICSKCHYEGRLAEQMHKKVITHNMNCIDCHDPHSGNAQYFLR